MLNNIINSYYPDYKLDLEQDSDWFIKIIGGYQVWLMREFVSGRLSDSLAKANNNDFFLLTLEDYLEKQSKIGDIEVIMRIEDCTNRNDPHSLLAADRVFWKMMLAVAINRARIYKREDIDVFTRDIISKIDNG